MHLFYMQIESLLGKMILTKSTIKILFLESFWHLFYKHINNVFLLKKKLQLIQIRINQKLQVKIYRVMKFEFSKNLLI